VNLAEALADLSRRQGWDDRVAYRAPDRSVTHGQVHAGAAYAASILAGLGVARGDRVVIAVDDRIEFVWAFLGALRLGAIAVPVDPALSPDDHAYVLLDTEPAAVVCAAGLAERFESDAPVLAAGTLGGMLGHASYGPAVQVDPDTPAYGQYTSGATGHPKLALHRHRDPEIYFRAFGAALAIGPDDTVLSMAGLHSAGGLSASLVFPLCSGGSALLRPGDHLVPGGELDDGELPLDGVGAEPTVLVAAPTWWARLLAAMPASPLPNLRVAVSTGETLTPALATRIRTWAGCPVLDGLVSTEVGSTFCSNTPAATREGSVGRALPPYRVRVADADGNEVPIGSQGTLWVRGPTVLTAYWGKPEATAEVMRDGWLRTGDLASVDADGYVRHLGRADDVEIVQGVSLSPVEIERVLAGHIGVAEVAVAAIRDGSGASSLRAFVVPTDPGMAGDSLAASIVALAAERLAGPKVPGTVVFVDELPRTPTGVVRRFVLRGAEGEMAATGA
jgi:fatty-acyl-CoA synthase/fatty acid CoA ligase FadD22